MKKITLLMIAVFMVLVSIMAPVAGLAEEAVSPDMTPPGMNIYMAALPIIVPFVTALIRLVWKGIFKSLPGYLGPFKAIVAGMIVSALGRTLGVTLPTDLGAITDNTTTSILMSGVIIGSMGALIRNVFDSIKKRYPENTSLGKAIRAVSGSNMILDGK